MMALDYEAIRRDAYNAARSEIDRQRNLGTCDSARLAELNRQEALLATDPIGVRNAQIKELLDW